ncbi:ATP-binding cassette domain-containing protein [Egibacter rhizosphaerae]|uniref:ABC-type quaternary amine transporter n=1 Tax=Egibacter rhizosphaerae TaxID=1670831 RepID=A0A411YJV5_9ACTN|nr:ABC transporter ATP-binding protein [Egibacter rhizosphaerae]QBI21473.1 ATP-binding cassette domain-containing protein [Egibacter rhizosphaerae]
MTTMIELRELTKRYPGAEEIAVDAIDMEIHEGEIVVLVGPSGCGKTTTLKMINRIIEPSSGRIIIEDRDVTHENPDHLRRRIGYVIQQVGLFPHQTVAQNIATVPRLLGWDRDQVTERVDELLSLVSLDPAQHRDRYPKELSGGQRQRVGVARALAADPPIMLMDEPFGAIDPINRDRLQNEFLRLQEEIQKTIVFVTHDIDEAIKMGDRIAIFGNDHRIQQFDVPERLLSEPANDFVDDFTGSGASLKRLNLQRVRDVELGDWPNLPSSTSRETLQERLAEIEQAFLLLLDEEGRPVRWVSERDLSRPQWTPDVGLAVRAVVPERATLHDALDEMLTSNVGVAAVIDDQRRYLGVVDIDTIMTAVNTMRQETRELVAVAAWHAPVDGGQSAGGARRVAGGDA